MKIINPLYDKAFKYLMLNNRLAKKVLEVILDIEIEELTLGQQETVVPHETRALTLFRLDFKALVKQPDGTKRQILIELQKSKFDTDIRRFRNYLGANYISKYPKRDNLTENREIPASEQEIFPIVTIYILGYKLEDLPFLAVTVTNQVINSINKQPINVESFFVNMLTHRSHILQVTRLPESRQTRLEKFLTLFNQSWYAEEKYILDLEEIPEEFLDIAQYLQLPVFNEEFRRQLAGEEEIDAIFDQQGAKYLLKISEAQEKEKLALEKEKLALEEVKEKSIKLALKMLKYGEHIDEIMHETGLTRENIEKLL